MTKEFCDVCGIQIDTDTQSIIVKDFCMRGIMIPANPGVKMVCTKCYNAIGDTVFELRQKMKGE